MASPDRIKNSQLFLLIWLKPPWAWVRNTIPQAITTTTTVLIAVARFELTSSIPTLANMEVSAANTADNNANTSHIVAYFTLPFQSFLPNVTLLKYSRIQLRSKDSAAEAADSLTLLRLPEK